MRPFLRPHSSYSVIAPILCGENSLFYRSEGYMKSIVVLCILLAGSFSFAADYQPTLNGSRFGRCKGGSKLTAEVEVFTTSREVADEVLQAVCNALGHEVADQVDSGLGSVPMHSKTEGTCTVNDGRSVVAKLSVKAQTIGGSVSGFEGGCATWSPVQPHYTSHDL
jgi:hypothetical protein